LDFGAEKVDVVQNRAANERGELRSHERQVEKTDMRRFKREMSFSTADADKYCNKVLDATLDRFEKHKPSLLANLRDAHRRGSNDKAFDEKGALYGLKFFACSYIALSIARKRTRPSPDTRERFDRLVIDMERVRRLLGELMNSNEFKYVCNAEQRIEADAMRGVTAVQYSAGVLDAVVQEACKNPDVPKRFKSLPSDMERVHQLLHGLLVRHNLFSSIWKTMEVSVTQEIIAATSSLRVLESVVREACKNVPAGSRGRPHDRALWPRDVELLAELFSKSGPLRWENGPEGTKIMGSRRRGRGAVATDASANAKSGPRASRLWRGRYQSGSGLPGRISRQH
jgi:hypothetical protein